MHGGMSCCHVGDAVLHVNRHARARRTDTSTQHTVGCAVDGRVVRTFGDACKDASNACTNARTHARACRQATPQQGHAQIPHVRADINCAEGPCREVQRHATRGGAIGRMVSLVCLLSSSNESLWLRSIDGGHHDWPWFL